MRKRGPKSKIQKLPKFLQEKINKLVLEGIWNYKDIADHINVLAKGSVVTTVNIGTHSRILNKHLQKTQQARELVEKLYAQYGDDSSNKIGQAINELVRTGLLEITQNILEYQEKLDLSNPEEIKKITALTAGIAHALRAVEQSATMNQERERKLRKMIERESTTKLRRAGLDANSLDKAIQAIIG